MVIGLVDYAFTAGLGAILGEDWGIFGALLSWVPWITLLFVGGLALVQVLRWALEHGACRRMGLGVVLPILSAFVMLHGTQQGDAVAALVEEGLAGGLTGGEGSGLLFILFVWAAGGVFGLFDVVQYCGVSGLICVATVGIAAVYYLFVSVRTARAAVRWQQSLAAVRGGGVTSPARFLHPGWLAIALTIAFIGCFITTVIVLLFLFGVFAE